MSPLRLIRSVKFRPEPVFIMALLVGIEFAFPVARPFTDIGKSAIAVWETESFVRLAKRKVQPETGGKDA